MYCLDWAGPKPVPSGVRGTVGVDNQQADVFPNTVDFNYQKEESIIWVRSTVMAMLCAAVMGLCPTKPTQAQNAGTTEWFTRGKPSVLGTAFAAVAGLVCMTTVAGFVQPMSALILRNGR